MRDRCIRHVRHVWSCSWCGPDVNTVVGDNDTFRQFMTCMLDTDGDDNISEEEITTVLEAGSEDPVIVEEGEIKDCFEPLYVTGTVLHLRLQVLMLIVQIS